MSYLYIKIGSDYRMNQQFLFIIQTMEKAMKKLCQFVSELAHFQQTVTTSKLSMVEVRAMMGLVDVKQKGYLDLNDIFQLVGNVNENQLFAIFKFFDTKKTGQIRVEQFEEAIGCTTMTSKNTNKEYIFPRFYKIVDTIKDKPKKQAQLLSENNFSANVLKQMFEYVCGLVQSKYLSFSQFVTVIKAQSIKYGFKWLEESEFVLKEMFHGQNISEGKFIQAFTKNTTNQSQQIEDQLLLNGIQQNRYSSMSPPKLDEKQVKINPITANKQIKIVDDSNSSIIYKKVNNFVLEEQKNPPHPQTPSFRNKNSFVMEQSPKNKQKQNFEQIEGNINEVLVNIQQRRQKLRQDSLQRKKLIDDVMQRKKQLCEVNGFSNGAQNWEFKEQIGVRQSNPISNISTLKKASKTYLNHSYAPTKPQNLQQKYLNRQSQYGASRQQYPSQMSSYVGKNNRQDSYQIQSSYLARKAPSQHKYEVRQFFNPNEHKYQPKDNYLNENIDIGDIMKKYSRQIQNRKTRNDEETTLKQLCKSKSGYIYSTQIQNYPTTFSDQYPQYQDFKGKLGRGAISNSSSKLSVSSKENVLRRAEEEAARKIEQIERKARMKVLQRKKDTVSGVKRNINNRFQKREEQDWGRLHKRGVNF